MNDPITARKYLDLVLGKERLTVSPAKTLAQEIQRLDRPARARGLTDIRSRFLPSTNTTAILLQANPQRRFFTFMGNAPTVFFGPSFCGILSTFSWQWQSGQVPIFFKEEDYGALVTFEWSYQASGLLGNGINVIEEVYIE